jgi:hypothetical protein
MDPGEVSTAPLADEVFEAMLVNCDTASAVSIKAGGSQEDDIYVVSSEMSAADMRSGLKADTGQRDDTAVPPRILAATGAQVEPGKASGVSPTDRVTKVITESDGIASAESHDDGKSKLGATEELEEISAAPQLEGGSQAMPVNMAQLYLYHVRLMEAMKRSRKKLIEAMKMSKEELTEAMMRKEELTKVIKMS